MDKITYLNFDLRIEEKDPGYRARVSQSPAGEAAARFTLPVQDQEWSGIVAVKAFGRHLFESVFIDEVRSCLRRSLDEANRQGARLRIRLHLADVPELAALPWEYLYDPSDEHFLSLSADTPIVRYLDLAQPTHSMAVKPPLKALVMISSPSDAPPLNVEQEWVRLRQALGDLEEQGLIALKRMEEATLEALQRRLRQGAYHIFHFVGHGDFDQETQDGVLILENEAGQKRPVSGQVLGTLLGDHPSLRLATLNACEGARTSQSDPYAGVAQRLVQQGIPAVIAMQSELSDEAAVAFAHEFYAAMADSYPVDAALTEARKAIFSQGHEVEWGTPVLYMRSAEGMIWEVEREETDMSQDNKPNWWDNLPDTIGDFSADDIGGDVIIATVGDGAKNVAVGKKITQIVQETLGKATPNDGQIIAQQLAQVKAVLREIQGQVDPVTWVRAEDRVPILEGELTKTKETETPSSSTIITVGDWLLDNVPEIAEALTSLFATPAVGRVVGKAGEAAVNWVKQRFGAGGSPRKG
jgi:hypothetical protein